MMTFHDIREDRYLNRVETHLISSHVYQNRFSLVFYGRGNNYQGIFLINRVQNFGVGMHTAVFFDEFAEANILLGNSEDFFELYKCGVNHGDRCKVNYIFPSPTRVKEERIRWKIGESVSDYTTVNSYFSSQHQASECLRKITT